MKESRRFGEKSKAELVGVHPHLVVLVTHALLICEVDFTVFDGLRTQEEQDALVAAGASRTPNSRHLTGHAVDLVPYVGGRLSWKSEEAFKQIAKAMFDAVARHNIPASWGGHWDWKDLAHFELPWKVYP